MQIILDKDIATGENTIVIVDKKEIVFRGTQDSLLELIYDARSIAEAIQADLDADNIEDCEEVDYTQYQNFVKKYS